MTDMIRYKANKVQGTAVVVFLYWTDNPVYVLAENSAVSLSEFIDIAIEEFKSLEE